MEKKINYNEKLSGKKIGVLGNGYIGSNLKDFLKISAPHAQIFEFNRDNLDEISNFELDYFLNCAGNTGDFRRQPLETVESNVNLITFLLRNLNVKEAFVSLSSTRIYGFLPNEEIIFDETYTKNVNHLTLDSIYDNAKKLMECLMLNTPTSYKKVVARLSNVYGGYKLMDMNDSLYIKLLVRFAHEKNTLNVNQSAKSTKDYIFIDDAIEGILHCALFAKQDDVFNICLGKSYSIEEWVNFLEIKTNPFDDYPNLYSICSGEKAKNDLGFIAKYSLDNLTFKQILDDERD